VILSSFTVFPIANVPVSHLRRGSAVAEFDISFDYLELLEVDPSQVSRLGIEGLRERIKYKKKEWTGKEINPLYQQEARLNKERIRQFERVLQEPATLVGYLKHIREVRLEKKQQQEEEMRGLVAIATAGRRRIISAQQRKLLKNEARARQIPDSLVGQVLKDLGVVVDPSLTGAVPKPTVPHKSPALDRSVLAEIHNWLKILGKPSLYAMLEMAPGSHPAQLVSTAKLMYAKWSKILPKTTESIAWEKTLQACLTYLKDDEAKARYDRALFNQRIDDFLRRIDLVLAGPSVGRPEQLFLTRLGIEDFGLSSAVVDDCIASRADEKGVCFKRPVKIEIQLQGQIQCRVCLAWNEARYYKSCRNCGSFLGRRCHNPMCGAVVAGDAKVCPKCQLRLAQGRRYACLLELADTMLLRGKAAEARQACFLAGQILPGPQLENRLARAQLIQRLVEETHESVAKKAWSKTLETLRQLHEFAPQFRRQGIPSLTEINNYIEAAREKIHAIPAGQDPVKAAKICLGFLVHWTDCEEAFEKLRSVCRLLERQQQHSLARQLTQKLLELRSTESLTRNGKTTNGRNGDRTAYSD
jgi:hypothetical protein